MKTMFKAAIAAVVLTGAVSGARADLTINGAVGLPLNPTAQIPLPGGIRVQGNYYDQGRQAGVKEQTYGLVAAGRVADRIEINGGLLRDRISGGGISNNTNGVAIGAKYLFSRETDPVGVRLAAGGGFDRVAGRNAYGYLVATKSLGDLTEGRVPLTGHLGLRYDRFRPGGGTTANKTSVFAGLEVPFGGSFAAVGELQSKRFNGGDTPYSASVRYRPMGAPFSGSIGIARTGIGIRSGVFAQIGYSFDTNKASQ